MAAFTFRPIASRKDGASAGHATIAVSNEGAAFSDFRIWSYSYLIVQSARGIDSEHYDSAPFFASHATVVPAAKLTGEIATITVPFDERNLGDLRGRASAKYADDVVDAANSKKRKVISIGSPTTVVEIQYQDRAGARHRDYYQLESGISGWSKISVSEASSQWLIASAASGSFGIWAMKNDIARRAFGNELDWPSNLTPKERIRQAGAVIEFISDRVNCSIYGGVQAVQWRDAIAAALEHEKPDANSYLDASRYGTMEDGARVMGMTRWDTCDYNEPPARSGQVGTPIGSSAPSR